MGAVLRVVRWVAAAALAVVAFAISSAHGFGMPAAIIFLILALVAAPDSGNWLFAHTFRSKRWLYAASIALLIFVALPVVMVVYMPTAEEEAAHNAAIAQAKLVSQQEKEQRAQAERKADQERAVAQREERQQQAALKREKACKDTTGAFLVSRKFVEDNLRAPSTAKFPRSNAEGVSSVALGDCKFRVRAYVDAQNAFGAMIRSPYEVELILNPDTERWHALSVNILG